jgi:hypothetical protein
MLQTSRQTRAHQAPGEIDPQVHRSAVSATHNVRAVGEMFQPLEAENWEAGN